MNYHWQGRNLNFFNSSSIFRMIVWKKKQRRGVIACHHNNMVFTKTILCLLSIFCYVMEFEKTGNFCLFLGIWILNLPFCWHLTLAICVAVQVSNLQKRFLVQEMFFFLVQYTHGFYIAQGKRKLTTLEIKTFLRICHLHNIPIIWLCCC